MRIVLISCVSGKKEGQREACELYDSTWFHYAYQFALHSGADKIFILSAKYGLLPPDRIISPYNMTLNRMNACDRKTWAAGVIDCLKKECDLRKDRFCFLAGERYREFLLPYISWYMVPMSHMGIGQQVSFLKKHAGRADQVCTCGELHMLCRKAKRFYYPYDIREIPLNGIYIMFEKGEHGHGGERIVRVGTHTGDGQLRSRIRQHFEMENKDRSIFRKNIGRAVLNGRNDAYLKIWDLDNTGRQKREKNLTLRDLEFEKGLESEITAVIQNNFSFAIIEEADREKRLKLESKLVSTVSLCPVCCSSDTWMGNASPVEKIRRSGMWQVNELYKESLDTGDMDDLMANLVT